MTAIEKDVLQNDLCEGCDGCDAFAPVLTLAVTNNTSTKTATVTDASVFGAGDTFKKVLVNLYDVDGKKVSGVITAAAGNTVLSLVGLKTKGISITATVISTLGCKADMAIYDYDGRTGSGDLTNVAKQGKRN